VDIHDFKGKLIQLSLVQDRIVSYNTLMPELDFSGPVKFYDEKLLKIGESFYELEEGVVVYEAESVEGSYMVIEAVELYDIGENDLVRLYDLEGDNDGIVDTLIILKK
jgi:hypothetical protein